MNGRNNRGCIMTPIELGISQLLRLKLKEYNFSYKYLAEILNEHSGTHKLYNENALRSSICRGKLQASDLLLILHTVGLEKLELKDFVLLTKSENFS